MTFHKISSNNGYAGFIVNMALSKVEVPTPLVAGIMANGSVIEQNANVRIVKLRSSGVEVRLTSFPDLGTSEKPVKRVKKNQLKLVFDANKDAQASVQDSQTQAA